VIERRARRGSYRIVFGEERDRWSLADPGHPLVSRANHDARHNPLGTSSEQVGVLASITSDMHYLVHTCPSTKLACEKLASLRAAVRALGPIDEEALSPGRDATTETKGDESEPDGRSQP